MEKTVSVAFVDAGNTYIKVYNAELDLCVRLPVTTEPREVSRLIQESLQGITEVVVCSVQGKGDMGVQLWADEIQAQVRQVGVDIPSPLRTTYDERTRLGMDRQMMSLAFIAGWQSSGTVLSIGTAVTLEYICDSVHYGGHIAPGLDLLAHALADGTGALPKVDIFSVQTQGPSTTTSIIDGCRAMFEAYIDRQIHEALQRGVLLCTGGGAEVYAHKYKIPYCNNLVARGMKEAYLYAKKGKRV